MFTNVCNYKLYYFQKIYEKLDFFKEKNNNTQFILSDTKFTPVSEAQCTLGCPQWFCKNGGQCVGVNQCRCTSMYTGEQCEKASCPTKLNCDAKGTITTRLVCSTFFGGWCRIGKCSLF